MPLFTPPSDQHDDNDGANEDIDIPQSPSSLSSHHTRQAPHPTSRWSSFPRIRVQFLLRRPSSADAPIQRPSLQLSRIYLSTIPDATKQSWTLADLRQLPVFLQYCVETTRVHVWHMDSLQMLDSDWDMRSALRSCGEVVPGFVFGTEDALMEDRNGTEGEQWARLDRFRSLIGEVEVTEEEYERVSDTPRF
ncbi:hypothetical protein NpPPO83_00000248 [Neofusicoccum parvum]|uniref:Uncharacterized protein n=1 Tax=Neofusicoccum parvum TaxID=310453 RepID=A0ACB5SCY3_9PEZI|nr:hypothetical protein NpPPO83_00000248 [Neofusicoccum parvum]